MLAHSRKRARSPSPSMDADLTSPLDILLKRRRKSSYFDLGQPSSSSYYEAFDKDDPPNTGESSNPNQWTKFVERRRTKQWEKLNAPQVPSNNKPLNGTHDFPTHGHPFARPQPQPLPFPNGQHSYSQPELGQHYHTSHAGPSVHHTPTNWSSQPNPSKGLMSSSPIRHQPPASSPFRPQSSYSNVTHNNEPWNESYEEYEPMDEEDMKREWGEEYANQNSLLHSIHKSRTKISSTPSTAPFPTPSPAGYGTPDQTLLQTPSLSPYPLSNGYTSNAQSSMMKQTPLPYRNSYFDSSPFTSQTLDLTPQHTEIDDHMDSDHIMDNSRGGDIEELETDAEVLHRYETANKLLAELEVDRRRRWGDTT